MDELTVAVVSDSHDNLANLEKVAHIANSKKCTHLFHLGDFVSPLSAKRLTPFKGIINAVFGNCDGEIDGLTQAVNTMGGFIEKPPFKITIRQKSILLMHEPYRLDELTRSQNADYIFYGHLHREKVKKIGKTITLNPGECAGIVRKAGFFIVDLLSGDYEQIHL